MKKTVTLELHENSMRRLNEILESETPIEGFKQIHTFHEMTANFGDGIEVDIKVCNGEPPFVDAILFENGYEVTTLEVSDEIEGEYDFEYNGNTYTVIVKPTSN